MAGQGNLLAIITTLFLIWSLLTLLVRLWVKLSAVKSWAHSDTAIVVAYLLSIGHVAAIYTAVSHGFGDYTLDTIGIVQPALAFKDTYTSSILYVLAVGVSKCSCALFVASLSGSAVQVRRAHVVTALCGLWTVASLLAIALRGDLSQPWNTVDGSNPLFIRWAVIETFGLAIEVGIFGLAGSLVWFLNMARRQRIYIMLAFGARLMLIPVVILRLVYLAPAQNDPTTSTGITAAILTEAVLQYALIAASITCLKPFIVPFYADRYAKPGESSTGGMRSGSYDPYHMLSTAAEQDKDAIEFKPTSSFTFRPDISHVSATAVGGEDALGLPKLHSGDKKSMVITQSKLTTFKSIQL